MKICYVLYAVCICGTLASCNRSGLSERPAIIRSRFKINFTDNELDSVIGEYVKTYEVDPKQRVLSLSVYRDPAKDIYFLTQLRRRDVVENAGADYFFVHNEQFLVLLRLGGSDFYKSIDVVTPLDSAMQRLGIALANDSLDYDPPSWELIKACEGKLHRRKKSNFVLNYLPCGYEIEQDSLHQDNFSLVKASDN